MTERHFDIKQLPMPNESLVSQTIEEIECPPDGCWRGHFALGTLAEKLVEKGFNPLGVGGELKEGAAEFMFCNEGRLGPGIYVIAGMPLDYQATHKGRTWQARRLPITSIDNPDHVLFIHPDQWVFKPVVPKTTTG